MTVVEAIVKWLKEARINKISTDALPGQSIAYGIAKAPTQNVKTFVSGRKIYTDYYDFLARLDSKTDAERVNNHKFMEELSEWIYEQNVQELYPELPEHLKCSDISVSTPFHMQAADEDSAVYAFTIKIKYEKER